LQQRITIRRATEFRAAKIIFGCESRAIPTARLWTTLMHCLSGTSQAGRFAA